MSPKTNIGNAVSMGQLLEFEVALSNEKKKSVEEYLEGGSREVILMAASFFLGFNNNNSEYKDNRKFLQMFFRRENNDFANKIFSIIRKYENNQVRIGIINPYSSLKLFEYFFSKPDEPGTQTEAEFEVNLFKAYLVLNSEFIEKQKTAFLSVEELEWDFKISMMMFCMQYPVSDKFNFDIKQIWATQIIKSIYLFQFLESTPKTKPLLTAFLKYFECESWQDYLKKLISLTSSAIKNEKEAHTDIVVEQGENFKEGCEFIEKLIITEQDNLDQNDFLTTRAKPFYKIDEGAYRIIYNLFVVEKIFKGAYFLLRDVNKTLPKADKIKDIRSFYGNDFSEQILCYKAIENIYTNNCIRFSGKELDDMKINAAPDYYIRSGNDILIFESKDFLVAADKKMSFDYEVYNEEFGRILDYEELPNGKEKPKAVLQLANNIRRILKSEFPPDTDYNYKRVNIYPILLTHDHQYNTPGFNELIDSWFQDELVRLKEDGLFVYRVKPISIVNIDTLIYFEIGLSKRVPLHSMLSKYHEFKKMPKRKKKFKSKEKFDQYIEMYKQQRISKLLPFSLYIERYFGQHNLHKLPPILEVVAPALFKEDTNNGISEE